MAQHDYTIANQGFPAFRSDLNDALAAIVSNNSGATEPTTMFAHQLWVDTAANPSVLKIRNADNDAWITIGTINQTGDTFTLTPAGGVVLPAGTSSLPSLTTTGDLNTGVYFPGADRVGITTGGTQRVEIDSSGTLLIGTTSATSSAFAGASTPKFVIEQSQIGSAIVSRAFTSATASGGGMVVLGRSNNASLGTLTTTTNNQGLGYIAFEGVNANATPATSYATYIASLQDGTAGATYVPGRLAFYTGTDASAATERMRIDSSGNFFVGKTADTAGVAGAHLGPSGFISCKRSAAGLAFFDRLTNDGELVSFIQDGTQEGSISVSGNTVSYNPFLGSHSGALADWSRSDIKIGTVMDTIDELLEYKVVVIDVQEEVPAKDAVLDEEGNEVEPAQEATTQTVQKRISYNGNGAVGSSATVEYEGQEYTGTIQHEREELLSFNKHLKVKVNDTAASKTVFGVFVGWNNDPNNDGGVYNDMLIGAVGNYVIRMAAGQTPEAGDLVEADGNGCAVVQDDDIIRTKTIAKVTSTIPQVTYDDGSFLVTCVLYCG